MDCGNITMVILNSEPGDSSVYDWQEEIYQEFKKLKDMYLSELYDTYQKICEKLQQHEFLPELSEMNQLDKIKLFRSSLERIITFLHTPKNNILPFHKEIMPSLKKQIIVLHEANRPRKPVPTLQLQPGEIRPSQMQSIQKPPKRPRLSVPSLQPDQILPQKQAMQQQLSRFSQQPQTSQAGDSLEGDWQEEVYQKIKNLKDMHFADLDEMHQKLCSNLQQYESLQPSKVFPLDKLRTFKNMFEELKQVLQTKKSNILPTHRENLPSFEKQIISLVSAKQPRKPVPTIEHGQIHHPQMQSTQQPPERPRLSLPSMQHDQILPQKQTMQQPLSHFSQEPQTSPLGESLAGDWQEEVYQKIQNLKEIHFADVDEMLQKVCSKMQLYESLHEPSKKTDLDNLRFYKNKLENLKQVLQTKKSNILPMHREKLPSLEKQIITFITPLTRRRPTHFLVQPEQSLSPNMQSMQQPNSQTSQP